MLERFSFPVRCVLLGRTDGGSKCGGEAAVGSVIKTNKLLKRRSDRVVQSQVDYAVESSDRVSTT